MSFQYTAELSDEHVWAWISMAFEGGSNYWIEQAVIPKEVSDRYKSSNTLSDDLIALQRSNEYNYLCQLPFLEGGAVELVTYEDDKFTLNRDGITVGLKLMATNSPHHFNDMVDERGDSITADVLLQYSLFGEVVYG